MRMSKGFHIREGVCRSNQIFTIKQVGEKAHEKKWRVYDDFLQLQKAYDRVNKEVLWQVLRMYEVGGKFLNGIRSMYVIL